jgi:hypothetical protein
LVGELQFASLIIGDGASDLFTLSSSPELRELFVPEFFLDGCVGFTFWLLAYATEVRATFTDRGDSIKQTLNQFCLNVRVWFFPRVRLTLLSAHVVDSDYDESRTEQYCYGSSISIVCIFVNHKRACCVLYVCQSLKQSMMLGKIAKTLGEQVENKKAKGEPRPLFHILQVRLTAYVATGRVRS